MSVFFRKIACIFLLTFTVSLLEATMIQQSPLYSQILTEENIPTSSLRKVLMLLGISPNASLEEIVSKTQEQWLQKNKERWEFAPFKEEHRIELIPLFKKIGLFEGIKATRKHYDYALIYGGFHSRVAKRLALLVEEYERGVRFEKIVFLTGQRFLDKTHESTFGLKTETEMMMFTWKNMKIPKELRNIPLQVIDVPAQLTSEGTWRRPNTKDTLLEWLKSNPPPGHCLFISYQPFIGYQDSTARTYLPLEFVIETIGYGSDEDAPVSVHLDNLARWIYQEMIRRKG